MDSFKNISKRDQIILMVLAGIIVIALYYVFLLSPQMQKLSDVQTKIEEEKQKLVENQLNLQRLRRVQVEAAKTEVELIKLRKLLPPEIELPSLIVQMSNTVVQSGLKWPEVRPGEIVSVPDYTIYPVQFTFKGQYLDFLDFLYRIYKFPRLMTINGIQMSQKTEQVDGKNVSVLEISVNSDVYKSSGTQSYSPSTSPGVSSPSGTAQSPQPGGGG